MLDYADLNVFGKTNLPNLENPLFNLITIIRVGEGALDVHSNYLGFNPHQM